MKQQMSSIILTLLLLGTAACATNAEKQQSNT